eukprot:14861390-Alexandrium_andersonii.AAC.1
MSASRSSRTIELTSAGRAASLVPGLRGPSNPVGCPVAAAPDGPVARGECCQRISQGRLERRRQCQSSGPGSRG